MSFSPGVVSPGLRTDQVSHAKQTVDEETQCLERLTFNVLTRNQFAATTEYTAIYLKRLGGSPVALPECLKNEEGV